MDDKTKTEIAVRLMEATLKSPALGNLPGNRDEIIENIKVVFKEAIKATLGVVRAKD